MRFWNQVVAAWGDILSLGLTTLILLGAATLTAIFWYTWPSWWNFLRRLTFGRSVLDSEPGREVTITDAKLDAIAESEEELPEVDPAVFASLADRYAAQGLFAEAVRERLRAMVRELVTSGVITHHPGWTVNELAREAKTARAGVAHPVDEASVVFTGIWYAKQPALSTHDTQMRVLAQELTAELLRGRK